MEEFVEYETKLVSNFLTKSRFTYALPLALIILCLSLVLSNVYWHLELGQYLQATPSLVFEKGEYWRLFTSSFIHGDLSHFLSNSLMLSVMSYLVISHYGYWVYPILSFTMGAVINLLVILSFKHDVAIVGASGVVYYLWGFWLVLYLFIQRHIPFTRKIMKIIAISLMVLIPTQFEANISYLAHGLGFALGIITGFLYFIFNKGFIYSKEKKIEVATPISNIPYQDPEDYYNQQEVTQEH